MNGCRLHEAAKANKLKTIEKLLDGGCSIDLVEGGFTALYVAVEAGHVEVVQYLLARKADPNIRCLMSTTALHIASRQGFLMILEMLVQCGGDLRLRDDEGRTAYEYAHDCPEPPRSKILGFISKKRFEAYRLSDGHSERKTAAAGGISRIKRRLSTGNQRRKWCTEQLLSGGGFGPMYQSCSAVGVPSHIQHVSQSLLFLADDAKTSWAGPMSVYQTMYWNNLKVTVKRSTINANISKGFRSDIIIQEIENLRRLSLHPYYLWPIAISPTQNMEDAYLVYEAVHLGSFFSVLYDSEHVQLTSGNLLVLLQQICEALIYLHEGGYVHGCLNPHIISVVTPYQAKLGGFEYTMHESSPSNGSKFRVTDRGILNYYFHWLAPEVLAQSAPVKSSDVYSMGALLWEVFTGMIPWSDDDLESVYQASVVSKKQLQVPTQVPEPLRDVVECALMPTTSQRNTDLDAIYQALALVICDSAQMNGAPHTWNRRITFDSLKSKKADKTVDFSMRSSFRTPPPYGADSSFDDGSTSAITPSEEEQTDGATHYESMTFHQTPSDKKHMMSTPKPRPASVSSKADDSDTSEVSVNLEKAKNLIKERFAKLGSMVTPSKSEKIGFKPAGIRRGVSPQFTTPMHYSMATCQPYKANPKIPISQKFSHIPGSPSRIEKSLRFEDCLDESLYAKVDKKEPPAPVRKIDDVDGRIRSNRESSENSNTQSAADMVVKQVPMEANHKYKLEVVTSADPRAHHIVRLIKINQATGETEVHEEYGTSEAIHFEMQCNRITGTASQVSSP